MKKLSTVCTSALLSAMALMCACNPQGPNIAELSEMQKRNAELRQEIAEMRALIRRAGEDVPELADQIEARTREVAQAYKTLETLKAQETEIRMRRIELEGRLDAFRGAFREMQTQVVAADNN